MIRTTVWNHPSHPPITGKHTLDQDGVPSGGTTDSTGIMIDWQNGPLVVDGERKEPNGAFVESVIIAAIDRLQFFQESEFRCAQNTRALKKLREALECLRERTAQRQARGVEGTHEV